MPGLPKRAGFRKQGHPKRAVFGKRGHAKRTGFQMTILLHYFFLHFFVVVENLPNVH